MPGDETRERLFMAARRFCLTVKDKAVYRCMRGRSFLDYMPALWLVLCGRRGLGHALEAVERICGLNVLHALGTRRIGRYIDLRTGD
jgi:hypothetical protein